MARIYQSESYGDNFAGSLQSRGFNPVAAVDRSQQEREKAKQAVANINREIDILGRDQQLERTVQSAQQATERANLQAKQQAIKGLLALSQTALKAGQLYIDHKDQVEQENQELESIGIGENVDSPPPPPPVSPPPPVESTQQQQPPVDQNRREADSIDFQINASSTATNQIASELEASGDLIDKDVANQLRQETAYRVASEVKGNIFKARGAHALYLQEALRLIPDDQKPRSLPEAQALLRSLNRQFFRLCIFGQNLCYRIGISFASISGDSLPAML